MIEIEFVDLNFLDQLLDSDEYEHTPCEKFVYGGEVNGVEVWVAVNNDDGKAITHDFSTCDAAMRWLNGLPAYTIYGELV